MDIELVERKLFEYAILEKRIQTQIQERDRSKLLEVALSLGPKDGQPQDMSETRVQGITPQDWVYNWNRAIMLIKQKDDMVTESIADCARKQIEIRYKVGLALLLPKEDLYCEQRYFLGLSYKEIDIENKKEIRRSALEKIGAIFDRV